MKKTRGFVIAGTNSGAGKTTVTLGIMAWLGKQGYRVAPFKVGPDFIDPGHHARITGTASRNLDGWMLSEEYNLNTYRRFSADADIAVVEGVMGLYDGYDGKSEAGSTAQMAKWLNLPVILVLNAASMARSAAAVIRGFVDFDPEINFAGIVFNGLGSANHYNYLAEAVEAYLSVPLLGGILRNDRVMIPERHLGLVTDDEHTLGQGDVDLLADMIGQGIDTEHLTKGLEPSMPEEPEEDPSLRPASLVRIGVARDEAFCFYYQDNLDMLEQMGARLVFFSPVEDKKLPDRLGGIYLGGGYPEVFAERLSENRNMREDVKQASDRGMPIYGECGGFMYLCSMFLGSDAFSKGTRFPMTGCFPFSIRLLERLKALGYREVCLSENTVIGSEGMRARGHEFHYSEITDPEPAERDLNIRRLYSVSDRRGQSSRKEGFSVNNTVGSYVHLHFGSNPEFCRHFVGSCRDYMNRINGDDRETG